MQIKIIFATIICLFCIFIISENIHNNISAKNSNFNSLIMQKRNWFLGHKNVADLIDALDIIAVSTDIYQNSIKNTEISIPIKTKFNDAILKLEYLAKYSIGMEEIYTIPATYLLFEEQNPEKALYIAKLGLKDKKDNIRVLFISAFIAHVFLRDLSLSGFYYGEIAKMANAPKWLKELSHKLLQGNDPYDHSESVRKNINNLVYNVFPNAKKIFEKHQKEYEKRKYKK